MTWAFAALAAFSPEAQAQRVPFLTVGSLAADDANPAIDRASGVLMMHGPTRGQFVGSSGSLAFADLNALSAAMTTTGLVDPAAKAALDLGPRDWTRAVRIEITSVGNQSVKLSVSVNPEAAGIRQADPAGRLFRELVDRTKAIVDRSVQSRRAEVKARLDELEKQRAAAKATSDALRKRIREAETAANSATSFNAGPNRRRQLASELDAKRARLKAIETITPRLPAEDEHGKALKELVAAREAIVAALEELVPQARAQPLELFRARADLAEARVQAAQGGRTPFSGPLQILREERLGLEVDVLALEAQFKAMPEEVARPSPDDAQTLRNEQFQADQEIRTIETQLQQARRDLEQIGSAPSLVLLDGQPG